MAPYEALYGRKCIWPLPWEQVEKRKLLRLEMIQQTRQSLMKETKFVVSVTSKRSDEFWYERKIEP